MSNKSEFRQYCQKYAEDRIKQSVKNIQCTLTLRMVLSKVCRRQNKTKC
jgi:hypothetical protein